MKVGKVLSLGGGRMKRGVLFDGSHVGHKKSEPATQIEVSLGGTHEGSPTPQMGPDSGGARARRSDKSIPRRVEAQDG